MNTGTGDTRFPHLDLEDLIAEAAGQPLGGPAAEHLASCEHCRLEANRWNLVAGGVRDLAAAVPGTGAPGAGGRTPRRRVRPRVLAGSAAAALVLIGSGYAVTTALSRPATQTLLTAVSGCSQLEQASGTLERVNGTSLVIKTASGQPVTVTTTAATRLSAAGNLLGDITDGTPVLVVGPSASGTVAADLVLLGGKPTVSPPSGLVVAQGTVADAGTAGFTVVTPAGTRVPVTTSGSTAVSVAGASLGQLRVGGTMTAVGYAGPHGTLAALAALQPPSWPAGAHSTIRVKDCSPASVSQAIMMLAYGG